jgi:hypothetical protein
MLVAGGLSRLLRKALGSAGARGYALIEVRALQALESSAPDAFATIASRT